MAPKSKFAEMRFDEAEIRQWTPDWECPGRGFRCKRGEFVSYWRQGTIKRDVRLHLCRCWVIAVNNDMVAYITLLADKLVIEGLLSENEGVGYGTVPAVKIGWLAADERAKGAGTRLVEWAIEYVASELSPQLGIRYHNR